MDQKSYSNHNRTAKYRREMKKKRVRRNTVVTLFLTCAILFSVVKIMEISENTFASVITDENILEMTDNKISNETKEESVNAELNGSEIKQESLETELNSAEIEEENIQSELNTPEFEEESVIPELNKTEIKEDNFKTEDSQIKDSQTDNNEWNLALVNPWNKLPDNFSVERTTLKNGHSIDKRAYNDLQAMMDDARAEGLSPIICSSFRTMEKQQSLFDNQVQKYLSLGYSMEIAEKEAAKLVAVPGTSEHQLGLALDIVALSYQHLVEEQENTSEQKWLMANSYKYGFILRYPKNKVEITGISYEPWHYRYVGKEAANEIYKQGICLEEFLQK